MLDRPRALSMEPDGGVLPHAELGGVIQERTSEGTSPGDVDTLRAILDHSSDITILIDGSGVIRTDSLAVESMLGYRRGEVVGRTVFELMHPDDIGYIAQELGAIVADPDSRPTVRARARHRDGSYRWVEAVASNRLADPVLGAIIVTIRDIAGRVQVEAELQAGRERYRLIVEHLPLVSYTIERPYRDDDRNARYIAPGIEALLGVSVEEWLADPDIWLARVHPDDRDRVDAEWEATAERGLPFDMEYRMVRRDGVVVWIRDRAIVSIRGDHEVIEGVFEDVTERRDAHERLEAAETRYRTLVEQIPAVTYIWEVDQTGNSVPFYTSPRIEQMLGFTSEEWASSGSPWLERVHPDDRAHLEEELRRAELTGEPWRQEFRFLHKDGRPVWVHDESTLLSTDTQGRPRLFQGVMFDITDRMEARTALEESLERFRALSGQAPVGIFQTDPDGGCTYVNEHWSSLTGLGPREAMGAGWATALHPEDRERVFAEWAASTRGGGDFASEYRFLGPDGEVRWVSGRASALRDAAGRVTGHIGTVVDTTQRRAAEEQLRLIRSAVEHTSQMVLVGTAAPTEAGTRVVYANPAFTSALGVSLEELVGQPISMIRTAKDDRTPRTEIIEALSRGGSASRASWVVRPDGTRLLLEWAASPIVDETGTPTHLVVVARDVTDIREAERGLRDSIEILRRADAERRSVMAQIVESQEAELGRLAEGIEDRSLQQLSAVRMRMETLRRSISDPAQLGALEKMEVSVEQAVGQLRGLMSELRPRELETDGLEAAIRAYVTRYVDGSLLPIVDGSLGDEPSVTQRALAFRLVQESVGSAIDRRGATRLELRFGGDAERFTIRLADDGAPWDPQDEPFLSDGRLDVAEGSYEISHDDGSTAVEFSLPREPPPALSEG